MKKTLLTYLLSLITILPLWATGDNDKEKDGKKSSDPVKRSITTPPAVKRTFPTLGSTALPVIEDESGLYDEGWIGLDNSGDQIDSIKYYIEQGRAVIAKIREAGNYVKRLDNQSLFELPVGIAKVVDGINYDIGIHSIELKPNYAELEVYMTFEVPQNGQVLVFRGTGIKFTKEGGIVGDATLELLTDYAMNFDGGKAQLILKGTSSSDVGTFVTFDCDGFKEMALDAAVKFSRDMLRPEDSNGNVTTGNVTSTFKSVVRSWNDLIVEVDMPPFQLPSLQGVGFSVRNAVFDFSDVQNAPSVRFPADYQHPDIQAGIPELWRGFYLRELSVRLPKQFEAKDTTQRTTFEAYDVIIDNIGVTGDFISKNLIPLNDGNMNGWAFSLDSIGISLQANELMSAGFNGDIVIPVSKQEKAFGYHAIINPGNEYIFNVSSTDSIEFSMFKTSKVELYPASYLEVSVIDNKFRPKANLHGRMNISAKLGNSDKGFEVADITFEDLTIQSVKPYIQVGNFSFGSEGLEQKMANFPVSINNIGMRSISDYEVGLDFDLILNLTGKDGGAFGADAGLTLIGELPAGERIQNWKFKSVQVRDIAIDIDGGAFKFKGSLKFYREDAVYGDGFNGQVQAEFKPGIKVQATAIFGNVDGYRYWYVDALASLPTGIPIFTGVGIYGFGGGAYYRMAMDTQGTGSPLGETVSGVVYVPKENAGLGLKATIEIASHPKPEAFTGDVTFEMAFFQGGGLRYISFKGNGYLATPPADGALAKIKEKTGKLASAVAKLEKSMAGSAAAPLLCENAATDQTVTQIYGQIGDASGQKGQISAHVFISYDFENRVLHGNFEAYVNIAGGLIQGVGPGGRAGWAVLHFAPDEWYVYVGTPDDPMGLKMGVGPISAQTTSYFMVGTTIPGSPPPPDNVANILGLDASDLDYMRDLNALGNGAGFAFGAAFGIDTGDLTFLMFYARFAAGAGFDIMLKDYGNAQCAGASGPIGINGWYANGQAYAYFEGKVGIRIKIFGKRKKINILDIGAAAILQAKLPNPFWMRGIVGGRFSILGGLVKGQCKFEVTLGKECELINEGSVVEGIKVISAVTPNNGDRDINVFTAPQAVFNMQVNKVFQMIDLDDKMKSFRIKLDEFKLVQDSYEIPGEYVWNDEQDVLAFDAYDILPSEKEVKVIAQVSFEENVSGSWAPVIVEGVKYVERVESTFTSGIAPDHIPHDNIEYSYPVISQLNFHKDEYGQGYIKLKKGQPDLFQLGDEWAQKGRITSVSGSKAFFDFNYANSTREVTFNIPSGIENGQIHAFEIVNLPAQVAQAIDRNVSSVTNNVEAGGETIETEITTKQADGTISELQEKSIFSAHFRASNYPTFGAKIASQTVFDTFRGLLIPWDIHYLTSPITTDEYFDQAEISGNKSTGYQSMVYLEADVQGNSYYENYVYPLVYEDYPINGIRVTYRDIDSLGLIPTRAMNIRQTNENERLEESDIVAGVYSASDNLSYRYNMSYYMAYDFYEIQAKVVERYISSTNVSPRIQRIIAGRFPIIQPGTFNVEIRYRLPGRSNYNSSKRITLTYD